MIYYDFIFYLFSFHYKRESFHVPFARYGIHQREVTFFLLSACFMSQRFNGFRRNLVLWIYMYFILFYPLSVYTIIHYFYEAHKCRTEYFRKFHNKF
jgi:hypothetical protein